MLLFDFGGCVQKGKEAGAQPLALWLEVPSQARLGEIVPLKLKLKNTSDRPISLTLGGRPAHDFRVINADGVEIWRWSRGQAIQQILQLQKLSPSQELEFLAEWAQVDHEGRPIPPGTYRVWGILNLEPPQRLAAEPKTLLILP